MFRAQRSAGAVPSFDLHSVEVVVATGDGASLNGWDLEGWKGTGFETSFAVSPQAIHGMFAGAGATNLTLVQRLAALAPEITHEQRIAYAVPIEALPFLRRGIANQIGLGNKLTTLGATLEGYLRFELKIPQHLLANILTAIAAAPRRPRSRAGRSKPRSASTPTSSRGCSTERCHRGSRAWDRRSWRSAPRS